MEQDAALTEAALGLLTLNKLPVKRKAMLDDEAVIRCICGYSHDDGFSIACDDCGVWVHSACFDITRENVPNEWQCWDCRPRAVDREKAARLQREKLKALGVDDKKRKQKKRRAQTDEIQEWQQNYIHIDTDIVPEETTRDRLRKHAKHWRGITAISPDIPLTQVQTLHDSPSPVSLADDPRVRPPKYSLHTTCPIAEEQLIAPYKSLITPSSVYLSNPLNAYAHMGMPKTFVHLLGPPLDVTLDSRTYGNESRFARHGCRPNAVLRPLICDTEPETLSFGVFALRNIEQGEEVVLGWEWDDGNAVHKLPAVISTPNMFPPEQLQHLHSQMAEILHSLSSAFVTCACGSSAKDCALAQMAQFVDGPVPPSPQQVDLGPLVGENRGFRTREKTRGAGGFDGVEMADIEDRKGKGRERRSLSPEQDEERMPHKLRKLRKQWMASLQADDSILPPPPPQSVTPEDKMDVDQGEEPPPRPRPKKPPRKRRNSTKKSAASRLVTALSDPSPSTSFSRLSLQSPMDVQEPEPDLGTVPEEEADTLKSPMLDWTPLKREKKLPPVNGDGSPRRRSKSRSKSNSPQPAPKQDVDMEDEIIVVDDLEPPIPSTPLPLPQAATNGSLQQHTPEPQLDPVTPPVDPHPKPELEPEPVPEPEQLTSQTSPETDLVPAPQPVTTNGLPARPLGRPPARSPSPLATRHSLPPRPLRPPSPVPRHGLPQRPASPPVPAHGLPPRPSSPSRPPLFPLSLAFKPTPTPSPPPQTPKVKLSLSDFAARKRKEKEEREKAQEEERKRQKEFEERCLEELKEKRRIQAEKEQAEIEAQKQRAQTPPKSQAEGGREDGEIVPSPPPQQPSSSPSLAQLSQALGLGLDFGGLLPAVGGPQPPTQPRSFLPNSFSPSLFTTPVPLKMASPASTNSSNSNTSLNSRNVHSLPQRGTPIRRGFDRPIPNAPRALRNRGGVPRGGGGPGPSSSGGGFHHPQDRDRHWRTSSGGGSYR